MPRPAGARARGAGADDVPPRDAPPRALVVGAGRAGRSMAAALDAAGAPAPGLHGRERPFPPALGRADVVLVATPDAAVSGVLRDLAAAPLAPGAVVLQLSGARAPDAADDALRAAGAAVGTFHPLVPLADPALGAERLRGAWVGVGGDTAAVAAGEALAARLGARPLRVPDAAEARARYHAAAVFASNFPVVLAAEAERLFAAAGVERGAAQGAVRHLLAAAAANVAVAPDAARALTGPVARGDVTTVARHLAALAGDVEAEALYRALARATVAVARGGGGSDAGALDVLEELLG